MPGPQSIPAAPEIGDFQRKACISVQGQYREWGVGGGGVGYLPQQPGK